ncbi:MAG: hypothetical protein GY758_03100 [Fuerstiella sp.]|nr:hypothetical protein [Fuerstiella sp.]
MKRTVFVVSLCVATALLVCAFNTRGKEGMLSFFLGAALLFCTLALSGLRLVVRKTSETNKFVNLGAFMGLFLGGTFGAKSGFGGAMISIFNPELPIQEFGALLGALGGGVLGAFVLALLCGSLQALTSARAQDVAGKHDVETLSIYLLLVAWALYAFCLLIPCASIQNYDGAPGQALAWDGTTTKLPGYQILQLVFFPLNWVFVYPLIYCVVNLVFFLSPVFVIRRNHGRRTWGYGYVVVLAALAAWIAPVLLVRLFFGYLAWVLSITLAAVAMHLWLPCSSAVD